MSEDFKSSEKESVKILLQLLARRGYVRKSELEHILRGCRHNRFVLEDLIQWIEEWFPQKNLYVEDEGTMEVIEDCLEIQQGLKEKNIEDLYDYLEIERDAADEEILLALNKKKQDEFHKKMRHLAKEDGRYYYELILRTQGIIEELQLRQRFNLSQISFVEYNQYLGEIILLAFVEKEMAQKLLDGYLRKMDFVVTMENEIDIVHPKQIEQVDEYLIYRGKNNG